MRRALRPTTHAFAGVAFAILTSSACSERSSTTSASPPPIETGVRVARVSWPARERVDRAALARMPAVEAARVARAKVPVLVPFDDELLARGVVISEPLFYAFAASFDGMNVSLQGTRGEYAGGEVAPFDRADRLRGTRAIISETDAIWTATWIENGVAYALSVECARADDARCQGKGFIRELAERLVFVGGDEGGAR